MPGRGSAPSLAMRRYPAAFGSTTLMRSEKPERELDSPVSWV